MTENTELRRVSETLAVTELLNRFVWTADVGELEDFTGYFTEDAEWDMGETVWEGREDIVAGLGSMREAGYSGPQVGTRHFVHDIDLVEITAESARARSVYMLISPGETPAILSIGTYEDDLVRVDRGWKLRRRVVRTL